MRAVASENCTVPFPFKMVRKVWQLHKVIVSLLYNILQPNSAILLN